MTESHPFHLSNLVVRPIQENDLFKGFLDSLDSLREASNLDKLKAITILKEVQKNPNHVIFVAEMNGRVIGSSTLLIEPKFIHDGGLVGHIEDVVVSKEMQGNNIGKKIIETCLNYAKERGCYKTILCCNDDVKKFYIKLGFTSRGTEMRFDH